MADRPIPRGDRLADRSAERHGCGHGRRRPCPHPDLPMAYSSLMRSPLIRRSIGPLLDEAISATAIPITTGAKSQ
ncbi:hypothetical protein GCM10023108_01360 [Saccharopolyspora hordei]